MQNTSAKNISGPFNLPLPTVENFEEQVRLLEMLTGGHFPCAASRELLSRQYGYRCWDLMRPHLMDKGERERKLSVPLRLVQENKKNSDSYSDTFSELGEEERNKRKRLLHERFSPVPAEAEVLHEDNTPKEYEEKYEGGFDKYLIQYVVPALAQWREWNPDLDLDIFSEDVIATEKWCFMILALMMDRCPTEEYYYNTIKYLLWGSGLILFNDIPDLCDPIRHTKRRWYILQG